jgi:hypothetical protein
MHNAVAYFYFLLFVHERLSEVWIMAILDGRALERAQTSTKSFFPLLWRADLRLSKGIGAAAPIALTGAM